jgi:predicted nuclease of predicted toxin-antitoxin system
MKFQAYMGVSPQTVEVLRQNGYEAVHLIEEGWERLEDSLILEKARLEGRIVLTFDLDLGELLAASGDALPSVIIFRVQNTTPNFVSARLLQVLAECSQDLATGAIITVQDNRYRLRRLPIQPLEN